MDTSGMRMSYERGELDEACATDKPLAMFTRWFEEARTEPGVEANAMVVSTADATGRPSSRVVLLKGFDESGLVWFTNYHSRKGRELAENPRAALLFDWHWLQRQVRVEGQVVQVSPESPTTTSPSAPSTRASAPGPRRRAR
ncbi:pyridoxal 5'-phosphate synthase [Schaalia sp. 19OD2882]|uniref:pyridoxine/pyridoxamine 5'-phosphate oxidase n=1 Tax=Schaalia sp. 19OD2882 TaxID=2794089 RepID=UPI001C1EB0BB|nr:pyridoxal 5'-phosphate synthase [Schaalia sp. 19OD2882]QWW19021.1 pyridoxal 5'-phosphate synthase [Schaalia sp. 19OD2882]